MRKQQSYPSQYEIWNIFTTIVCKVLNADYKDRVGIAEAEARARLGETYSDLPERLANSALRLVAWMETWGKRG